MKNIFGKIVGIVLTIAMVASCISFTAFADYDLTGTTKYFEGAGTEADPYLISTAADLVTLAELTRVLDSTYADKYYKLTADIDMTGVEFDGICEKEKTEEDGTLVVDSDISAFSGTIDGNYHVISNMTVDRSDIGEKNNVYAGLICNSAAGAVIKNLGLVDASVKAFFGAGAFIGIGGGTITNCFVRGVDLCATTTKSYCGGFIGYVYSNVSIDDCYIMDIARRKWGTETGTLNISTIRGTTKSGATLTLSDIYSDEFISSSLGTNLASKVTSDTDFTTFMTNANGAFEDDTFGQNGGYPVLAWENGFYITFGEGNTIKLANRVSDAVDGIIIVAGYKDSDEMVGAAALKDGNDEDVYEIELAGKDEVTYTYTPVEDATIYKAFVWNGLTDLTPLCVSAVYNTAE